MSDLQPIDIEINMRQNVSEEAPKVTAANEDAAKSADALQNKIAELNGVIADMKKTIEAQEAMMAASNETIVGAARRLEVMNLTLEKSEKELATYEDLLRQTAKATQEGADMTDILVDARKGLAATEETLVDNAKDLIDNQKEINDSLDDGAKNSDAYSVSNQAASFAIREVATALGIENAAVVSAISNTTNISGAKKIWTAITTKLTAAQLALSATILGGVVVAIGAAVYAVKSWYDNQKELIRVANIEKNLLLESTTAIQQQTSRVQVLDKVLNDSTRSYKDRNSALNELRGIMPEYNAQLSQEGELIKDNTNAVQKYIEKLRDQEMAKRAISKLADAQTNYDEWRNSAPDWAKPMIDATEVETKTWKNGAWQDWQNKKKEYTDEIKRLETIAEKYVVGQPIKDNTKEFWENEKQKAEALLETMTDLEKGSEKWNAALKQYKEAEQRLTAWDFKEKKIKSAKTNPKETATTSLSKMSDDIQKRIDQARVKSIHEGAEKERAAIRAEYDATQAYIGQKQREIEQLEKKTGKPATDQRDKLFVLDVEATRQFETQLAAVNVNAQKTLTQLMNEVNARFASNLDSNLQEIKRFYESVIAEAKRADKDVDLAPFLDAQAKDEERAKWVDQLHRTELDEALELEKANHLESIGLTTIAEQTKLEIARKFLTERIALLRKINDEASNREADILEARLNNLQSSPKNVSGMVNATLYRELQKGLQKVGLSADEAREKADNLFRDIQKGGATAASAIGNLSTMFGGLSDGLDETLDSLGSIAQGFASGGIAGGVMATIGAGVKLFSHSRQVEREHQQALKELALAKIQLQREYNMLLLKEQMHYKAGSNIFGADQIRGAVNAIEVYRKAMSDLSTEMKGDKPEFSVFGIDKYRNQMQAYNDGVGALADVDIVTGSRKSGWGFWKKRKDVYSSLLDTYDDVIDKEGNLNTARIEAILNTHKMSDENRALLESLLSLSEVAKEAEESLRDYLSQTFGSLGNSLADSIVTAFRTGEDAAQIFKGNVTDVLNDLSKQMVFGLYLKETFDGLEKDIHKAYKDLADDKISEEQLSKKITDILGGFFGGIGGDIENANKFLEDFWANAEANGFERPQADRQGAKGALANASQDSINELTGGVYAVRQMVGDIRQTSREELLVAQTIASAMNVLVERSEYWVFLSELKTIREGINELTYGVKVKV